MASEPERPIEKLLRDAARKRRDEAPASFEPHPATRRLLQGEIARRYPQAGRDASHRSDWLRKIFPKLCWAFGSLAVVAICVWVLSPTSSHKNQEEQLFARNEPVPAPAPPVDAERRLQPAAASDEGRASATLTHAPSSPTLTPSEHSIASRQAALSSTALAKEVSPALRADSLTISNPAAGSPSLFDTGKTPSLAGAMGEKKAESQVASTDLDRSFADKSLAPTPPAGVARSKDNAPRANPISGFAQNQPMPSAAVAWAGAAAATPATVSPASETAPAASAFASGLALQAVTNSGPGLSLAQQFVRNIPKSKTFAGQTAQTPDQHLLVSFQVEQSGSELRVKDEDGSVYLGYLQPAGTATVVSDTMKAVPATAGRSANLKLTDAAATSAGSSPSAPQPYSPQTYFFRVAGTNQTLKLPVLFSGSISNAPGYGLSPTQLSGAHISGRVRVGTQREFELQASPR